MPTPTIESRKHRKFILVTADASLAAALRAAVPGGWQIVETHELEQLGGFQDILLHRFILLDLDSGGAYDPLEIVRRVRMELMLNVPVFCFGGDPSLRDQARLARADRFFERGEMVGKMKLYCGQYGWGG
ncbi:MAG: hypothetical protein HYU77_12570 [Betaproteobacteria bacterium]|nr:hypothetical protein [Betaproteobacteria bacterium]